MTNPFDYTAYSDFSKRAFAPMLRIQEAAAKAIEQVSKYQYELAGDYLHYGIDQLHVVTKAKDPADMFSKSADLTSSFIDKLTKRTQEFTKLATETQTSFVSVVEETTVKGKKAA